jgi:hypothetical protein
MAITFGFPPIMNNLQAPIVILLAVAIVAPVASIHLEAESDQSLKFTMCTGPTVFASTFAQNHHRAVVYRTSQGC